VENVVIITSDLAFCPVFEIGYKQLEVNAVLFEELYKHLLLLGGPSGAFFFLTALHYCIVLEWESDFRYVQPRALN